MKLIVLYGPENSGKTMTLKRLYETLKQHNVYETKCFKFYDSDHLHNDFRDVLVLDKSKPIIVQNGTTKIEVYDGRDVDAIKKAFPDMDNIDNLYLNDNELGTDVENVSFFLNSITKGKNQVSIGFILEGDYGFEHIVTSRSYICRYRNLYWHLKELRSCDIVVCACSVYIKIKLLFLNQNRNL